MRKLYLLVALSLAFSLSATAEDKQPKPEISKDPLTHEQVAVYRAVLVDYVKAKDGSLNLADKTEPLARSGSFWPDCVKSIDLEPPPKSGPLVHKIDSAADLGIKFVLVNPDAQVAIVKTNDPGNVIHSGAETGKPLTDEAIDDAVKRAFVTALFTLSEIIFDKDHKYAVVSFRFHCGMLCGHGGTVVLQKKGETWKITKTCSNWIS